MIIVFEGIDACGKQTQTKLLDNLFTEDGHHCRVFSFPEYSTGVGQRISEMLRLPDSERDPLVLQSLMTVNRYELSAELRAADAAGIAIVDRYWLSGLVYGQTDGISKCWLEKVHFDLPKPTLTILLDISVDESFRRRPVREDAYESSKSRLHRAKGLYLAAIATEQIPHPDRAVVLDGERDKLQLHDNIVDAIAKVSVLGPAQ